MTNEAGHSLPTDEITQYLTRSFDKPTHFFCGWSGGIDSTCVLFLLRSFVMHHPMHKLTAVHINHGIHPQSLQWQSDCELLARQYAVDFIARSVHVDHHKGTECAARDARWAVFNGLMSDLPRCVVLGHHVEDQAESFLLNLLRGAGLSGLGSMRRLVSRPHLKLLRPLLPYTKSQCLSYIQSLGLSTVTDSSNFETLYARNYLRGHVMPPLASRWPNVYDRFEKSIRALQSDWDLLSSYALERLNAISKIQFGLLCIDRTRFNRLSDSERHLLFRVYLRQKQWYLPSRLQIDSILNQLQTAGAGRDCVFSTHQFTLRVYRNDIYIYPLGYFSVTPADMLTPSMPVQMLTFSCPNLCRLDTDDIHIEGNRYQLLFDKASISNIMSMKRLKKYYQSQGIPPFLRTVTPILVAGNSILPVKVCAHSSPVFDQAQYSDS